MSIEKNNPIPWKKRIIEALIDYFVILAYLLLLFVFFVIFYRFVLGSIPEFTEWQTQILTTFTSVIPIILIFSYFDFNGGSIGKRVAKLDLHFEDKSFLSCILRNIIKFLPWQIGHVGTIRAMYYNYDLTSILIQWIALILLVFLLVMMFKRQDKRHLGDLLAKTQVRVQE